MVIINLSLVLRYLNFHIIKNIVSYRAITTGKAMCYGYRLNLIRFYVNVPPDPEVDKTEVYFSAKIPLGGAIISAHLRPQTAQSNSNYQLAVLRLWHEKVNALESESENYEQLTGLVVLLNLRYADTMQNYCNTFIALYV